MDFRNKDGSVFIFIFLIIVLIYPFALYCAAGYGQQVFTSRFIKQSMNRAVTSAAMYIDTVYEYDLVEEGEDEVPPVVIFRINEEKARKAFDDVLSMNLAEKGFSREDYSYDLFIEGEIVGQFKWAASSYDRRLGGGVINEYKGGKGGEFVEPRVKIGGPSIIAVLRVKNPGFFRSDEVKTYRVASSELVIPQKYADEFRLVEE